MNIQKIAVFFLFIFLSAFSQGIFAAVTCRPYKSKVLNDTMPLSEVITVGNDIPVGAAIYNIGTSSQEWIGVTCNGPYSLYGLMDYGSTPMPLSSFSANGLSGKVYQTNVSGIGVVLGKEKDPRTPVLGNILPFRYWTFNSSATKGGSELRTTYVDLSLIKTGPISGGVINSALLPTMKYTVMPTSGSYIGVPFQIWTVKFTGSLKIVAGTCNVANVTVDMGKHNVADFSSVGSTSDWKDASIVLTNCPQFHGYNPYSSPVVRDHYGRRTEQRVANTLEVYLQPTSSETQNAAQGILNTSAESGKTAASGFGIQLGWGSHTGSPSTVNFNTPFEYKLGLNSNSSTIKIPLAARYIRTGSQVQSGVANSRVTFVVQYK